MTACGAVVNASLWVWMRASSGSGQNEVADRSAPGDPDRIISVSAGRPGRAAGSLTRQAETISSRPLGTPARDGRPCTMRYSTDASVPSPNGGDPVTAYTITYACLLVTGGRLGDLAGRKNMFIAGLVIFTISSALCGAAPSAEVLIAARALQGAGAALFCPQVLAFIQVSFDGEARNRALGVFGAALGLAVVAGQIVGGSLIAANLFDWHWRTIFLVNVPIGMAAVAAAMAWLPAGRGADRPRLDGLAPQLRSGAAQRPSG